MEAGGRDGTTQVSWTDSPQPYHSAATASPPDPDPIRMPPGQIETLLSNVHVRSIDWSQDGRWFAAGGADGVLHCIELGTGRHWSVPISPGHYISATQWRPGTEELACSSGDDVWLTDPRARHFRSVVSADSLQPGSLSWSPDGQHLAVAGKYLNLRTWDAPQDEVRMAQDTQRGELKGVAWNPRGSAIATASEDGTIGLWTIEQHLDHVLRRGVESDKTPARCVAWSPDGLHLAGGFGDGAVVTWDVRSAGQAMQLEVQAHAVCSVHYSRCGRFLIVARGDLSVAAVKCASGQAHELQRGRENWVGACTTAQSPTSASIAVACAGTPGVGMIDASELFG